MVGLRRLTYSSTATVIFFFHYAILQTGAEFRPEFDNIKIAGDLQNKNFLTLVTEEPKQTHA